MKIEIVKNDGVIERWLTGTCARNHRDSLTTDGRKLYSYSLCIGDTCATTGKKIVRDYTANGHWGFRSQTTSCHVGLARREADIVG